MSKRFCLQRSIVNIVTVRLNLLSRPVSINYCFSIKANLAVQEAKLAVAMADLEAAQATLNAKEAELHEVQMMYERAMKEKQVSFTACKFIISCHSARGSGNKTM